MASLLRKRIVSILEYLFFLGLGLLLLWLSFRNLDLNEVWVDVVEAEYSWLFIALIFAILSHIARALRWNLLINAMGYKTKVSTTFFAVMVGYMANTAVPRMGEFMRCGVLSKKEKIPFNALFGTVISERLFDLVILFIIIFLMIAFQLELLGGFLSDVFGPLIESTFNNAGTIAILILSFVAILILAAFIIQKNKEYILKRPFYLKVLGFLRGLWEGILTIHKLKSKSLFLFYSALIWLCYAFMVYIPVMMLPETASLLFIDGLTILAIGSLGIVAPVPGGIGAYHFIVKAILVELYHIEGNAAGSFAAITHAGQTILNVGLGALSYFFLIFLAKKQPPLNE